jgi:NTP pyrophosphatase (non-canonical NTP hydrolase)
MISNVYRLYIQCISFVYTEKYLENYPVLLSVFIDNEFSWCRLKLEAEQKQPNKEKMTFKDLQELNAGIYRVQNDRNYSTADMVSRIHRYVVQVLKAVRKGKTDRSGYDLSMALSWSLALANRLHLDLDQETWKRFPNVCPYCSNKPCACGERPEERTVTREGGLKPETFSDYQKMFSQIYPHNTLKDSAMHMSEEIGEVDEAVKYFTGTHNQMMFEEIVTELVDLITNMCAVASTLGIDLALEMKNLFLDGCPKCRCTPCDCWFTVAKSVSIR